MLTASFKSQFSEKIYAIGFIVAVIASSLWASYEIWTTPSWEFIPSWKDDLVLQVRELPNSSTLTSVIEEGDLITHVDSVKIRPGYIPLEPATSYLFTIEREGETLEADVPSQRTPTWLDISSRIPVILNAIVALILGTIILYFFNFKESYGHHIAFILILRGIQGVGLQGWLQGGRYLWWMAIPLTCVVAVCVVYLGYLPRNKPLKKLHKAHIGLFGLLAIAVILSAIYERISLYPTSSIASAYGYSPYRASLALVSIAGISRELTVFARMLTAKTSQEKHNLRTLLYFLVLSTIPVIFLTLIPRALFGIYLLPFPIAICLAQLVFIGYFYITYKTNNNYLDGFMSRLLTGIVLIVIGTSFSGALIYVAGQSIRLNGDSVSIIVLTSILLAMILVSPIQALTNRVVFGKIPSINRLLPLIESRYSERDLYLPNLSEFITQIAEDISVSDIVVLQRSEDGVDILAQHGVKELKDLDTLTSSSMMHESFFRNRLDQYEGFVRRNDWVSIVQPISSGTQVLGYIVASQPQQVPRNAKQLGYFEDASVLLSTILQLSLLNEHITQLATNLLDVQWRERSELSIRLHNSPLYLINCAEQQISEQLSRDDLASNNLIAANKFLRDAKKEIRQVCNGLFPESVGDGVQIVLEELADDYSIVHGLNIKRDIVIPDDLSLPESETRIVYQIVQEALNNIVRHAEASNVLIKAYTESNRLFVQVIDDGKGFEIKNTSDQKHSSLGLGGMWYLASQYGELQVKSSVGNGTSILYAHDIHQHNTRYSST